MKRLLYGLLIIGAIVGAVAYGSIDALWDDMCRNQIVEEAQSPDRKFKAVIFTRDCGATTGYSTQLSILENADHLENESGNTFILSDKVNDGLTFDHGGGKTKVVWIDEESVTVYFDGQNQCDKAEDRR